jgi:hypothetical protein
MVKSGKYTVKQPNIFGRIGTGIGKGLAESLPKEMDRGRLSAGLQQFEKESENLNPLQQYTRLAAIPGITPQMIQALPEVLKQQNQAKALIEQGNSSNTPPPFPVQQQTLENQPSSGLTTRPGLEATRKGYIPPTYQQTLARAGELYKSNPQLYSNDPQKAIAAAQQEASQEQAINQAYQQQRQGEQNIQNSVQSNLQSQAGLLKATVPPNVYSDIEQRAVKSVLPIEEGGEGLTDQEAKVKYGNELDKRSRAYSNLRALGGWTIPFQKTSEVLRNLKSSRKTFKENDDLRNFADTLVTENGLSNSKAYYLAYPNSDIPELNKTLSKIPDVNPKMTLREDIFERKHAYNQDAILHQISPKLAKDMGKEGSPLSVAEELQGKGYDPSIFLNYLDENREKLDLTPRQVDELAKPRNFFPTLNDIWLFKKIGKDKLVE